MWSTNVKVPVICRKCGHGTVAHRMNGCAHRFSDLPPCDCDGWERDPWDELPHHAEQ